MYRFFKGPLVLGTLLLLLLLLPGRAGGASPPQSRISVLTFNSSGTGTFGYAAELWGQGGTVLTETCFSPCGFTVTNGESNFLAVDDYAGQCFDHWNDGSRERFRDVTIPAADSSTSVQYQASYADCPPAATAQLTVNSENQFATQIDGYYTVLYNAEGSQNSAGFTPATFTLDTSLSYFIQVQNFGGCTFARWSDTGDTNPTRAITVSTDTSLLAVYDCV